jgi:outer membrane lipoprotein carrier protein
MFNHGRFILALLFLIAFGSLYVARSTEAASSGLEQRVLQLQKKYQQLRSLEFEFSQSTLTSGRVKQGAGNAIFFRPGALDKPAGTNQGIMRWNYIEPTAQTIINDGKELSIYTPQDKQLIVSSAQEMESDITYAIFTGTKSLLDEFEASPADKLFILNDPPAGLEAILLIPRQPHPQVKRVQLWLNGDFTIHRLLMEDHFGAMTELTFAKVRLNTLAQGDGKQVQALLKLDLVPGTETIRQ